MSAPILLIAAGLLHMSLLVAHGMYIALAHGIRWGTGTRAEPVDRRDLDRRFERSVQNNVESMVAFVPVLAAAILLEAAPRIVLSSAQVYLAARIAFTALYLFNVPYVRTAVWFVSIASIATIAAAILMAVF